MHFKVRKPLLSFTRFFSNKLITIAFKKKVLQSLVIIPGLKNLELCKKKSKNINV